MTSTCRVRGQTDIAMATGRERSVLRAALGAGISIAVLVVLAASVLPAGHRANDVGSSASSQGKTAQLAQLHRRVQELLTYHFGATTLGDTGAESGNLGRFWNYGQDFATHKPPPTQHGWTDEGHDGGQGMFGLFGVDAPDAPSGEAYAEGKKDAEDRYVASRPSSVAQEEESSPEDEVAGASAAEEPNAADEDAATDADAPTDDEQVQGPGENEPPAAENTEPVSAVDTGLELDPATDADAPTDDEQGPGENEPPAAENTEPMSAVDTGLELDPATDVDAPTDDDQGPGENEPPVEDNTVLFDPASDADSPTDDEFSAVVSARKEQDSHQEELNQQFEADIDQHQEDQSELSVSKAEEQHEMDSKKAEEESKAEQQKEEQEHEHLADLETLEKPAREQRCQKAKAQVQEFCDA